MNTNSPYPHRSTPAQRTALLGVLAAVALAAGYLEVLLPLPLGVPGVKLGLGNAVILFALERLDARGALVLMLIKVCCSTVLFANPQMLAFSMAGGLLSWAVMLAATKSGLFSTVAASVLGGLAHNAGQLVMVALLLSPSVAWVNLPFLAVAGVLCGLAVGLVVRAVLAAVPEEGRHA